MKQIAAFIFSFLFIVITILSEFFYVELWAIGGLIVGTALLVQIILTIVAITRKSSMKKFVAGSLLVGLIILGFKSFSIFGYSEVLRATQDNDFYNFSLSIKDNGRFEFSSPSIFGSSNPYKGNCEITEDSIYFYNPIVIDKKSYRHGLLSTQNLVLIGKSKDSVEFDLVINKLKNTP